jgi:uncharacterized protein (DUF302 family)
MSESMSFDVLLPTDLDSAIERTTAALQAEGFGVLTRIDMHTAFAEKLGTEFRPYVILGACNPALAHTAVTQDPRVGLMLPCNVTVEQAEGGSLVRIVDPDMMLAAGSLAENDEIQGVAAAARERLQKVATALAS